MPRICGLAAALVALGVALAGAAPAGATFPGANGLLVFSSDRDSDFDLFVQNGDGSNLHKLVVRPGTDEFNPSWNPSGTRLVFQTGLTNGSDFDLYLVNADGTGLTPLLVGSTNDLRAQFCDDSTVVFQRNVAGIGDIYAIRTDGTGLRRLTDDPASDSTPTCSPAGTTVAFSSTRGGVQGIYEVPLASAGAARGALLATPTLLAANGLDADYSPDGTTLAYAGPDPADGSADIFTKDLMTGAVVQVTSSAPPVQNRLPKFYPSGSSNLASRSLTGSGSALSNTRINAGGSHDVCLNAGTCSPVVAKADSGGTQPVSTCVCRSLELQALDVKTKRGPKDGGGRTVLITAVLQWQLTCTSGQGRCSGRLRFGGNDPGPRSLRVESVAEIVDGTSHPVPEGTQLASCSGRCEKRTVGEVELELRSRAYKNLRGTYSWRVTTRCSEGMADFDFSLALGKRGQTRGVVQVEQTSR